MDIKISEAIKKLEEIQKEHGDLKIYLEINEDITCEACGEIKSRRHDGFCQNISHIILSGHPDECVVWMLADEDC